VSHQGALREREGDHRDDVNGLDIFHLGEPIRVVLIEGARQRGLYLVFCTILAAIYLNHLEEATTKQNAGQGGAVSLQGGAVSLRV